MRSFVSGRRLWSRRPGRCWRTRRRTRRGWDLWRRPVPGLWRVPKKPCGGTTADAPSSRRIMPPCPVCGRMDGSRGRRIAARPSARLTGLWCRERRRKDDEGRKAFVSGISRRAQEKGNDIPGSRRAPAPRPGMATGEAPGPQARAGRQGWPVCW